MDEGGVVLFRISPFYSESSLNNIRSLREQIDLNRHNQIQMGDKNARKLFRHNVGNGPV